MKHFLSFFFILSIHAANMDDFLNALAKVESSNNPKAINKKENALGVYQIRAAYYKDSNVLGKHIDVYNPIVAKKVVLSYFNRYEPKAVLNNDFETLARLHNAGPNHRKNKSHTDIYWSKIKKNLY
jgi:soluble lytic murein transglycosylase-like protein